MDKTIKRKISVFSKVMGWLNYIELVKKVKEIGFDGIDLTVRQFGHVLPENVEDDLPRAVEAANKEGIEIVSLTTSLIDPEDKFVHKILKTASSCGIKYYRLGWFHYDFKYEIFDFLEMCNNKIKEFQEINKYYHIHGDYQNHSGLRVGSPILDLKWLFKDLNPEWIGCRYDIRHATTEGAFSWPIGVKMLAKYISTIDIKDFHWKKKEKWEIVSVPLGEGMVDFNTFFNLLNELNIYVPLTLHFEYTPGGYWIEAPVKVDNPGKYYKIFKKDLDWLKERI